MHNEQRHISTDLLTKFLLGEVSSVEQLQVIEWLEADAANQAELDKLEAAWLKSGELCPAPLPVDVPQAWNTLEKRIDEHDHKKQRLRRFLNPAIYAAASIALIFILINVFKKEAVVPEPFIVNNLTTTSKTDTLPDGSLVTLNTGSQLTYLSQAEDMHRHMELQGEAFFDVVRDTLRPFIVKAGMGGIRVLGTRFNVKITNSSSVTVDVESGLVELFYPVASSGDTLRLELKAGERGILSHEQSSLRSTTSAPSSLFWKDKTLVFSNKPLQEVFKVLEQCYEVQINCNDNNINLTNLTATFRDKEVQEVLNVIVATFDIAYEQQGQTYRIYNP